MVKKKSLTDDDLLAEEMEDMDEMRELKKELKIMPTLNLSNVNAKSTKLLLKITKEHKMIRSKDIVPTV